MQTEDHERRRTDSTFDTLRTRALWTIAIDRTKRRKTDIDDEGRHPENRWIRETDIRNIG